MWGMTAMKKGTAMKDKKKRAGGGGAPSTGTYPEGSAPNDIGCASLGVSPGALHASILLRDSQIGGGGGFLQLTTAGGTNINSSVAPDFGIADFVATNLRGETPINDPLLVGNPQMQPGVIRAVGSTSADVELIFRMKVLNGSIDLQRWFSFNSNCRSDRVRFHQSTLSSFRFTIRQPPFWPSRCLIE